MGLITIDQIQAATAFKRERVPVPEWATPENPHPEVLVQELTAQQRGRIIARLKAAETDPKVWESLFAEAAVLACVKEDGSPQFLAEHVAVLSQRSSAPLNRIFLVTQRISGMLADAAEAAKAGFPQSPSGFSGTPSPSSSGS